MNVASLVAAPDPNPPAAVLIAGDAMLESQQGVPLVRQAARTRSVATSGGCWLGLVLRVDGEEEQYSLRPKIKDVLASRETTAGNYILKYINIYAK